MSFLTYCGRYTAISVALAFALATPGAFAKTAAQGKMPAPAVTAKAATHSDQNAPDFNAGLWKVVIAAHVWGPINKHTTHKECWKTARPQLTKAQVRKKCKVLKNTRHGNTYTTDITCPTSQGATHIHFSRTYAGNTATETGTIKLNIVTAHLKIHANRIGKCPATAKKRSRTVIPDAKRSGIQSMEESRP